MTPTRLVFAIIVGQLAIVALATPLPTIPDAYTIEYDAASSSGAAGTPSRYVYDAASNQDYFLRGERVTVRLSSPDAKFRLWSADTCFREGREEIVPGLFPTLEYVYTESKPCSEAHERGPGSDGSCSIFYAEWPESHTTSTIWIHEESSFPYYSYATYEDSPTEIYESFVYVTGHQAEADSSVFVIPDEDLCLAPRKVSENYEASFVQEFFNTADGSVDGVSKVLLAQNVGEGKHITKTLESDGPLVTFLLRLDLGNEYSLIEGEECIVDDASEDHFQRFDVPEGAELVSVTGQPGYRVRTEVWRIDAADDVTVLFELAIIFGEDSWHPHSVEVYMGDTLQSRADFEWREKAPTDDSLFDVPQDCS